jgi:tetratricopeptide (TPR) repeat protein
MLLSLQVALVCCAPAFGQQPPQKQPVSQTVGNALQGAQAAAQRAEDAARAALAAKEEAQKKQDETLKRLDTASAEMTGRAAFFQSIATIIIGFVAFAVTVAGIFGVVVGFRLSDSLKKVKQGEATANAAAEKIVEMKEGIEKHKLFLNNLQQQVTAALTDIEGKLQATLTPETGLIGVNLVSSVPQRSYDDDALIAFSDRLQITGDDLPPDRLAAFLVMLGNYWRRWKEYGRAIERIRRAIELNPGSATAHKTLGRAIWNEVAEALAASKIAISPAQVAMLKEAETELEAAQKLLAATGQHDEEIPFDLGTISRFQGDIRQAIGHYQKGAKLSKALALNEGREPDWDFEFALACLYAKTKQYQQALDVLKGVVGKTQSWSQDRRRVESRDYRAWTLSDPDFEEMLADPTWGPQVGAL